MMSTLELEALVCSLSTREALIEEVLKLRIQLEAAHEQIGQLKAELGWRPLRETSEEWEARRDGR